MSIFDKWAWIKRNWQYVIEEATALGLVFVGGTALNLAIYDEYRASEDIDLYDTRTKGAGTAHEKECLEKLSGRLSGKGFEIKSLSERAAWVGPNIKIEIFNDGTLFGKVLKRRVGQAEVLTFDARTYAKMKMAALLCRSVYDARDLVDLFVIEKRDGIDAPFPMHECATIENHFDERLRDIKGTKKADLLVFQSPGQIDGLPYDEFVKFRVSMHERLSQFR